MDAPRRHAREVRLSLQPVSAWLGPGGISQPAKANPPINPQPLQGVGNLLMNTDNTPGQAASDDLETQRFDDQDMVEVTTTSNMLDAPEPGSDVVCVLPSGATGRVVGGPERSGNMTWYRLATSYGEGWVFDDWLGRMDTASQEFPLGSRLVVTTALNLRRGPGVTNEILYLLPSGTRLTLHEGPVPNNGFKWYRVETDHYGNGWVISAWLRES